MLIACSTTTMMTGVEGIDMNSDDLLWGGIRRFAPLRAPLDVWLLPDDAGDEVVPLV
jgi:hypothetical protein